MKLEEGLYAYPWTQMTANNANAYLLSGPPLVIFDPGHEQLYDHVELGMAQDGIRQAPALVVLTHCHPDHMEAALKLQRQGSKVAMHPAEVEYLEGEGRQLAAMFGLSVPDVKIDLFLEEGEFTAGDQTMQVFHTPGHSPGHVCIYLPSYKALVAGDLIFAQGVGRVDFPGGDGEQLKASIERMRQLDLEWILPGHGPVIKGAEPIRRNFDFIVQMYFGML